MSAGEFPQKWNSVYELSFRHSPPQTDIRKANILDDYGNEAYSTHPVSHQAPEDVSREDLQFYWRGWSFMEMSDLLFYLYPVASHFEANRHLKCIDFFLYTLDLNSDKLKTLPEADQKGIESGLKWIWEVDGGEFADLGNCLGLQRIIGLL